MTFVDMTPDSSDRAYSEVTHRPNVTISAGLAEVIETTRTESNFRLDTEPVRIRPA